MASEATRNEKNWRPSSFRALAAALLCFLSWCRVDAQTDKDRLKALQDLARAAGEANTDAFLASLEQVLDAGNPTKSLPRILDAYSQFQVGKKGLEAGEFFRFHSAAARQLGKLNTVAQFNEMKRQLKNYSRWQGRLLLLDAAAGFRGSKNESYDIAIEALKDEAPVVIRRTLVYLKRVEDIKTLDAILARFMEVDQTGSRFKGDDWDRTRLAFRSTLTSMLKVNLPAAIDYQNYLSTRREWKGLFKPAENGGSGKTGLTLFGTEVTGKNIVFILDISGSMMATDPIVITEEDEKRHKTGVIKKKTAGEEEGKGEAGKVEKPEPEPEKVTERRRITRAKRELGKVVRALPEDVKINIVAYSSEVTSWKQKLVPSTPENRKQAAAFVDGLKADGITVTDMALETAFEDLSVDTIYLITDGAPTHIGSSGPEKPTDADELIKAIYQRVREVNFLRGIRIFTLGFPEAEVEFLKKLAAENAGSYAAIQ